MNRRLVGPLIGTLVLFIAACDETQRTGEPEAVFDESSINGVWHKAKLRSVPCHDSMSGEEFEVSVTIKQKDRELQGCGRALF